MKPIYPNMWVTEPLPLFIGHSLGVVRRRHLRAAGRARQLRDRRRTRTWRRRVRAAVDGHDARRDARRVRAAARAARCAPDPHLERRRRRDARQQSGHRPEPHHAAPVPCLRFLGRRLPARARRRRSARRTRHRTARPSTPIDAFSIGPLCQFDCLDPSLTTTFRTLRRTHDEAVPHTRGARRALSRFGVGRRPPGRRPRRSTSA